MKQLFYKNYATSIFKILYIFINGLFLYKYGSRQNFVSIYFILGFYAVFVSVFLFIDFYRIAALKKANLNLFFKLLVVSIVLIIFFITFTTDGNTLKVDRWSAMDVAIRALLNGEYPYTAIDHLKGRTSNFPGLLILGIPFYLLGNVGYLQVFSFLLLSYVLYQTTCIKQAVFYILLLIFSPAFWWEIFAISDLMSNIFICFCFILWWQNKFKNDLFAKPYLLGFITAFLILTRGIVAIPLVLVFFKPFVKARLAPKIKSSLVFVTTFFALIFMVIVNCPSYEILKNYNPLVLQTGYLPSSFHIIALIIPFFFAYKIQNFDHSFYKFATLLLFFPVITSFFFLWNKFGFAEIILKNKSDISYLAIIFPFLLFEISNKFKSTNEEISRSILRQ